MLFKYLEETMPSPNHCIDCDKPMQYSRGLCDDCYNKEERIRGMGENINENEEIRSKTEEVQQRVGLEVRK